MPRYVFDIFLYVHYNTIRSNRTIAKLARSTRAHQPTSCHFFLWPTRALSYNQQYICVNCVRRERKAIRAKPRIAEYNGDRRDPTTCIIYIYILYPQCVLWKIPHSGCAMMTRRNLPLRRWIYKYSAKMWVGQRATQRFQNVVMCSLLSIVDSSPIKRKSPHPGIGGWRGMRSTVFRCFWN